MQRRAAAIYAALFLLIAAGSYVMIGVAQEPAITVENPDHDLSEGDTVDIDGRTYTVETINPNVNQDERDATLTWTNASERQTATIENNSEVPAVNVTWPGQTARTEATLANGSTYEFNGSESPVVAEDETFTVARENQSEAFGIGDTVPYRGNLSTVTAIGDRNVTLAWGNPYNVTTQTTSNDTFEFRESFNVTAVLLDDPAVQNETFTVEGETFVRYTNGSTQLLSEYLPDPEVRNFSEGDSFGYVVDPAGYASENVTVVNVSAERVLVAWRGPVDREVVVDHGSNVTLGPQEEVFVPHLPDNDTLLLTSDATGYQAQRATQASFHTRINGLWGVSIMSALAAVFLIGAAYLPSRY
jgi:hypothetical protein